jgi:hypothetical protein
MFERYVGWLSQLCKSKKHVEVCLDTRVCTFHTPVTPPSLEPRPFAACNECPCVVQASIIKAHAIAVHSLTPTDAALVDSALCAHPVGGPLWKALFVDAHTHAEPVPDIGVLQSADLMLFPVIINHSTHICCHLFFFQKGRREIEYMKTGYDTYATSCTTQETSKKHTFSSAERVLMELSFCAVSGRYASAHAAFLRWRSHLGGKRRARGSVAVQAEVQRRSGVASWAWMAQLGLTEAEKSSAAVLCGLPEGGRSYHKQVIVHGQRRDTSIYENNRSHDSNTKYSFVSLKRLPAGGPPAPGHLYFGRIQRFVVVECTPSTGVPTPTLPIVFVDVHSDVGVPHPLDPDVLFTVPGLSPTLPVAVPVSWLSPVCFTLLLSDAGAPRYYGRVRPLL